MKNLKTTILSACIALCCLTNVNAQETHRGKSKGKIVMAGKPGTILVFGGGTSMPSSDGKDKAFLSNTTAINADLFLPLIKKGWDGGGARDHVKGHKICFGLNFGGSYSFGGSSGFGVTPNPFAVTGQTSSMVSDRGGDPAQAGFRMGAGPQANFWLGKFIVSPMVLGEYMSVTQKEISVVQTTVVGNQSYDFNLATLPETKTSGFAVTPKLRLHYMFNERFGLFADASYTMGPKIETTVSKLIPNGIANTPGNDYDLQALQTGTIVKGETKSTAYSAMGFNFGVVIGLGKNNHDTSKNSVSNVRRTAGGTPIDDTPKAVRSKTKSNSTNERTAGDIKKGWDGTVKGKTKTDNPTELCGCCGELRGLEHKIFHESKCSKTTELYYENDYVIDDEKILNHLGINEFIIKKGTYKPDYTKNPYGDILLILTKPVLVKELDKDFNSISFSGVRCKSGCDDEGQDCFQCKASIPPAALDFTYTLTPIIKNGKAHQVILSNKSISIKEGTNSSKNDSYRVACPPGLYPNGNNCYPCLGCHPCGNSYCDNLTNAVVNNTSSYDPISLIEDFKSNGSISKLVTKKDLVRLVIENSSKESFEGKPTPVKCECGDRVYAKDAAACKRICEFLDGASGY